MTIIYELKTKEFSKEEEIVESGFLIGNINEALEGFCVDRKQLNNILITHIFHLLDNQLILTKANS